MHWIYSIKTKLIAVIVASSLLVGAIVFALTPYMIQHELIETLIDERMFLVHDAYDEWPAGADDFANQSPEVIEQTVRRYFNDPTINTENLALDFTLISKEGIVLIAQGEFVQGEKVSLTFLRNTEGVELNGNDIAFMQMDEAIELTPRELTFMHALNETLISSVSWAIIILLPIGFWAGNRLARTLKRLTTAVNDMAEGNLSQQVEVNNKDESGALAIAFNRMNEDLVQAYNDIAAAKQTIEAQAEQLKELSIRDELTGLHNRRFFNDTVEQHLSMSDRYSKPLVLVLADVDYFKKINDQFSHAIGDEVLQALAKILQHEIRETDIVARYGGEEMAFSLLETDLNEAINMMNRIRLVIEEHDWSSIHPDLNVTMSFGVAERQTDETLSAQLDRADACLYQAKAQGRNKVCS